MSETLAARDPALDVVRSLAVSLVLIIHASGTGLSAPLGSMDWWSALAWDALARPAVPLFFLCTGALMLCRDIPLRRLFGHNLLRVVCAMLVWAFGYQLVDALGGGLTLSELWGAVKSTLLFQHEFHFYYLHILLLVYVFLPVARVFVRSASRRELKYLLVLWFVTGILIPLLKQFPPFSLIYPLGAWYQMNMAYAALGYALLGHYLRQYGHTIRRRWYLLAFCCGLALTFGGTAIASLRAGALSETFFEGMSPGPMLMALGLFGGILAREAWPAPVVKVTCRLSQASFCIYLIHILILRVLLRLGISAGASPCLLFIPLVCLLLLLIGWLAWELLHRVPVVKTWLV